MIYIWQVDEAVEDLQVVLRLARDDAVLLFALGIAYGKRGNFESAIKTLKLVLELNPENTNARVQLTQMYRICGQFDDAMEQCKLLYESADAPKCLLMLHADVLLHMARRESSPSKCVALINDLFALLNTTSQPINYSVASLKMIGDSLMFAATFGEQTFTRIVFPSQWPITSQADALRIAADAYFAVTKLRPSAESWNDVGLAFLRRSRLCGDTRMAKRAMMGFQHALSMDSCKQARSTLWTNMAQAVLLAGSPLSSLHCIKAALLLNANNALAWSFLALLFFTFKKYESSQHAIDMAMKEDAKLAETWCLQALLKEREGYSSVADLFGQSISLKPTSLAIERFSFHTMRMLHNGVPVKGTNMFDFDAVNDAVQMGRVDDQLIFFVALLAEQMGCFALASTWIDQCSSFPGNHLVHQQRITIQNVPFKSNRLTPTGEMTKMIRHMCAQHPLVILYPPDSTVDEDDEFAYDALIKGDIPSPCRGNYTQPGSFGSRVDFAENNLLFVHRMEVAGS
uniref:TPR_REGION domain-containing protein n=1 Tax=Ascaris lumbricoides TaxID=6252 RepID=A0A0M3IMG6_ASCLU